MLLISHIVILGREKSNLFCMIFNTDMSSKKQLILHSFYMFSKNKEKAGASGLQ